MRIGLDLTCSALPKPSGTSLYALALTRALADGFPEHELLACHRLSALRRRKFMPELPARVSRRYFWDRLAPGLSSRLDVFHGLESRAGRFAGKGRMRQVVTLHEVMHLWLPGFVGAPGAERRQRHFDEIARRADAIITPSAFEREKVIEHLRVSADRVHAIHLAPAPGFSPRTEPDPEVLARRGISGRYALFVGIIQPRKNVVRLLEAFAALSTDAKLVLAGPVHPSAGPEFDRQLARLGDRVMTLGYVPNHELPTLYAGAACMVFPSEYESFGIPVIEAMACGCPVVTSRGGALPEVAGPAAELCDPFSVDSIAEALGRVLGSASRAAELRTAGLERATQFSYARVARETEKLYRAVA